MTSRVRQQRAKERRRQQAHLRMYAKTLSKKKAKSPRKGDPDFTQASSKSAPAKVIPPPPPRRSPRGHKGSKKWKLSICFVFQGPTEKSAHLSQKVTHS